MGHFHITGSLSAFFLFLLAPGLGCSNKHKEIDYFLLKTIKNTKYNFNINFYTTSVEWGPKEAPTISHLVRYISISDASGKNEIFYKPDPLDDGGSALFPQDLLSPDQETLMLPLSQHAGFQFIHARSAGSDLKSGHHFDRISLKSEGVSMQILYHEFKTWKDNHSITFAASWSDSKPEIYHYDFSTKSLTTEPR